MITINLDTRSFTRGVSALAAQLEKPEELLQVLGRELVNRLRDHFRGKAQSEPNKLGGTRTYFWNQIARSVNQPVIDAGESTVRVQVSDPRFAQKLFGGTIRAKQAKALTIPLTPEAYGRTAATFEHETGKRLFLVKKGDVAEGLGYLAINEGGKITAEYALRTSVFQDPDPTALPDMDVVKDQVLAAGQDFVEIIGERMES